MNNNKILVAVDVDGTLINTEFDDFLREPEIEAIRHVRAAGHELALCTGRNALSCASVIDTAQGVLDGAPQILLNGALIFLNSPRRTLREAGLPRETIKRLVELFREYDVLPMIFGAESSGGQLIHEDLATNPVLTEYLQRRRDKVGAVEVVNDIMDYLPSMALEVGSIAELSKTTALTDRIRSEMGDQVWVVNTESLLSRGAFMWIEVYQPQCNKGAAINLLADELKIPRERVVAIGDNYNDLDMFTAAGHSVAMGNAPRDVQSAADRVAEHVRDHGAARVLEEIAAGDWPV
jgi:5-amino-6-(5-phospho-D-ribitylamino)uracil phosphatase